MLQATNNKDLEVVSPPDDTVSALRFSPVANFLLASSWDNHMRVWEIMPTGQTNPKAQQSHQGPVLDACWAPDGTKIFSASIDKTGQIWDLATNQMTQFAQHDAPIKTVNCIHSPSYTCVMTGSWDRTLKFWDLRQPTPMLSLNLPERVYAADVLFPLAVVATAQRHLIIYNLDPQPTEHKTMESPLKFQSRCLSIFTDKQKQPAGFALGSIEGRVAIQYMNPADPKKDNFTFKCHRSTSTGPQDIYAVNDMAFHPIYGRIVTVGSDGKWSFWDKDARTKVKFSGQIEQPLTACAFDSQGQILAYACGYDWSKGHEGFDPNKKPKIYLHACMDDLNPNIQRTK